MSRPEMKSFRNWLEQRIKGIWPAWKLRSSFLSSRKINSTAKVSFSPYSISRFNRAEKSIASGAYDIYLQDGTLITESRVSYSKRELIKFTTFLSHKK